MSYTAKEVREKFVEAVADLEFRDFLVSRDAQEPIVHVGERLGIISRTEACVLLRFVRGENTRDDLSRMIKEKKDVTQESTGSKEENSRS